MSYKAKSIDSSISAVLNEYIQAGSARIIKRSPNSHSYVVVISADDINSKTLEIRKRLHEVGYITSVTGPRRASVLGVKRRIPNNMRTKHALKAYGRGNTVFLKVGAPNPPVSPPPFPDPNGKPPKKTKKKKG